MKKSQFLRDSIYALQIQWFNKKQFTFEEIIIPLYKKPKIIDYMVLYYESSNPQNEMFYLTERRVPANLRRQENGVIIELDPNLTQFFIYKRGEKLV